MSKTPRHPLMVLSPLASAAALAAILIVLWALTGAGYFWPMWPVLAIAMALGLEGLGHWEERPGRLAQAGSEAGFFAVIALACCAIWAMAGGGYFWPVWPMLGLGLATSISWLSGRGHDHELEQRVDELSRTRRGALDVQASEMRRIERDLHDGAQARLVALSMKLGRAEERFRDREGGQEVTTVLREAREDASAAIRELRELARGIAPPVLSDRGLEAAVRSLADRTGGEVAVSATLTRRPSAAVEVAAYFVVAESLTNAAKHAPGARCEVNLDERGGDLFIEVTDFGAGGARAEGSGLTGLRQRVEALDGRFAVTSPADVGTQIEAVLPCGW